MLYNKTTLYSIMEYSFYLLMFYIVLCVHVVLMTLFIKILRVDKILVISLSFFSLFFSCLGFWEIMTTSMAIQLHIADIDLIIDGKYFEIGFYGISCLSLYLMSSCFYLYHLTITNTFTRLKMVGFFLFLLGIQLLSGLFGDFLFFILYGLQYFTPDFAHWLNWSNGVPMGYINQFSWGLWFILLGILVFYVNRKIPLLKILKKHK